MNTTAYIQKEIRIEHMKEQGLVLPCTKDLSIYQAPLSLYGKSIRNRIGIQPLEGFDSDLGGGPTDLVRRRYLRFVKGGAGLIWFEACAVSADGKSNPYQMALTDDNVTDFQNLLQLMDQTARESDCSPAFKVLQLTHSGRMSRDKDWNPLPLAARKNHREEDLPDCELPHLATDARIKQMVAEHVHAAELAAEAGFDAVDIKVCHGYFLSELLSAFHRPGPYGGSFDNRTRALFEIVDGINAATKGRIGIAVRLNAFDSVPAPYGYGIAKEGDSIRADLSETVRICRELHARGVQLINISASSPSKHLFGPEPTDSVYRNYVSSTDLITAAKLLKEQVPEVTFMCTGLSTFQDLGAEIGAGGIRDGWFDIAGFGRQALAYPDFANDILTSGGMDKMKCCTGCYNCYKLMDPGHTITGCIVRDREIYLPAFQKHVLKQN